MNIVLNDSIADGGQSAGGRQHPHAGAGGPPSGPAVRPPALTLQGLLGELNAAFAGLLDIAGIEVRTPSGGPLASEIAATNES